MKLIFLLLVFSAPVLATAQYNHPVAPFEYHRFYLKDAASELLELKYENSCEPADGHLLPDGKSVIIKNYKPHQRIYVRLRNQDGIITEVIQSPCYIDPVVGEL